MFEIEFALTQTIVASVHVLVFDGWFTFQFLNEMTMPVQPADEGRQAGMVPAGLRR